MKLDIDEYSKDGTLKFNVTGAYTIFFDKKDIGKPLNQVTKNDLKKYVKKLMNDSFWHYADFKFGEDYGFENCTVDYKDDEGRYIEEEVVSADDLSKIYDEKGGA